MKDLIYNIEATVKREGQGFHNSQTGLFERGVETQFKVKCIINPIKGRGVTEQVSMLSTLWETDRLWQMRCAERLIVSDVSEASSGDTVEAIGRSFLVVSVEDWSNVLWPQLKPLKHFKHILVESDK